MQNVRSGWNRWSGSIVLGFIIAPIFSCAYAAPPTGLVAVAGDRVVTLSWKRTGAAVQYKVYRSTSQGTASPALIASNITQRSIPRALDGAVTLDTGLTNCTIKNLDLLQVQFADSAVLNGTTYYYRVSSGTETALSSEVSALPRVSSGGITKDRFLKILPLGDSHTEGYAGNCNFGGYRDTLSRLLTGAGYQFTMVGATIANSDPQRGNPNHEGWGARTATDLLNDVVNHSIPANKPDLILLMIGANSFYWSSSENDAGPRRAYPSFDSLLTRLRAFRPEAFVLVAPVLHVRTGVDKNRWIDTYNASIKQLVLQRKSQGWQVDWVTELEGFDYSNQATDNEHPSQVGYRRMGVFWFDAINRIATATSIASFPHEVPAAATGGNGGRVISLSTHAPVPASGLFTPAGRALYRTGKINKVEYGTGSAGVGIRIQETE